MNENQNPFEENIQIQDFLKEKSCNRVRHEPDKILQRNAEFLLESSKKIETYDQETLDCMQAAYDAGYYIEVIDLAYSQDHKLRMGQHAVKADSSRSFVSNIISLLGTKETPWLVDY